MSLGETPEGKRFWEASDAASDSGRYQLLARAQYSRFLTLAHDPQLPPAEPWRVWYVRGGRGAGKSWTGANMLAKWEGENEPSVYAVVAPVFMDAVSKCVEGEKSGLLAVLGERVSHWNRSLGELYLKSGSRIICDGADDGADRVQGYNISGIWADEAGVWAKNNWEKSWFFSIMPALRIAPGKVIVTGTPKMGHPLVAYLMENEAIPVTHIRTSDNIENLDPQTVEDHYRQFPEGSLRRRQELDGEWIAALEGDVLRRQDWRYYDPQLLKQIKGKKIQLGNEVNRFSRTVVSVDTPFKDKESSDNVAIQLWGAHKGQRFLLDAKAEKMGYDQARRAIMEMSRWARKNWNCPHKVIIENAGFGVELIPDLQREIGLVEKTQPNAEGSKGMRALAAASELESHNCFLPGQMNQQGDGPEDAGRKACPAWVLSLINEAAMFQVDGSHGSHDDQVDAWSQAMNWLRSRQSEPMRIRTALSYIR